MAGKRKPRSKGKGKSTQPRKYPSSKVIACIKRESDANYGTKDEMARKMHADVNRCIAKS